MTGATNLTLFKNFRHERMLGAWLAFLLLLVPFIHPLAEANAASRPDAGFICSSFGASGKVTAPAQADDCPFGMACAGLAVPAAPLLAAWVALRFHWDALVVAAITNEIAPKPHGIWNRPPGHAPPLPV